MKEVGNWKRIKRKIVYENNWITVIEDDVTKPNGEPGIYGFLTSKGGSNVVPIDQEGNVYLMKQFRYTVERDAYDIPGGLLDEGEAPLAAAKRELKEETGITAQTWTPLGTLIPLLGLSTFEEHLFLAEDLSFGEQELDETEQGENVRVIKLPLQEAIDKIMNGEIEAENVAAGLFKAYYYLQNR